MNATADTSSQASGPASGHASGPQPLRAALPWIAFTAFLFFINFIARTIFSPLMLQIEPDLGLNHTEAGIVFFWISLGFCISMLLSGAVNSRITHRRCVGISAIVMGAAMSGAGLTQSFGSLQAMVFVMGLGGGLYLPSGVAALTSLVKPADYGKALSIHEMAPNLSFILSPVLVELLLPICSWRMILVGAGMVCMVGGAIYALFARGGDSHGAPLRLDVLLTIARRLDFWIYAALFLLAVGASMGPYSVLPLFLADEHGMSAERANTLLSLSRLPCPLIAVASGLIADKFGAVRTIAGYLLLTGIVTALLGLTSGAGLIAAVLLQPLLTACFFPAALTAMSHAFPGAQRPMAVALIVPMGILAGNGLLPPVLGLLGDTTGFEPGFVGLGVMLLAGLALMPLLKRSL